ncbi:MAG: hypothetical protein ACTIKR_01465 [Advenella sp.]|uniref:Uncharacterized protein n=1 Tax=Advenella kashmirensis TaxID=310575 RepID=A0A356LGI9_9BURK|nr:hypothetical protein [Advenella kashmirensis]
MSKSFIYNLILTIVAIVVFIFIGASVYDAFTRTPVNRTADDGGASSVSGQIEAATPDATQPEQSTAASDAPPVEQQQAEAAYDLTNEPASTNAAQGSANSARASGSEPAATGTPREAAPAPTPTPAPASPRPETSTSTARSSTNQQNAPASSPSPAKPATRSNPDLRAVIPPVPTAPPRAEGVPPPNTTSQDMYNATNSGLDNGNVSDSFPAPVSNFPAPVAPGATDNAPGVNNDEQRRLQELRNQKQQLRRDLGF